jgi:hypothetical protein
MGSVAAQTVRWEDYRGDQNTATDANYTGAAGLPKFVNYPGSGGIAALRPIAANPSNAVRTGTSTQIDFVENATTSLCNDQTAYGGSLTSVPCLLQAQGKVVYAFLYFPQAGTYSLSAAHDDNLAIELSPDYTNTNYHSANYTILAGTVGGWTSDSNTFETFGTFTAANAGSCALLRMFWINQGGKNFTRLSWTPPVGGAALIPASAFRDPSDPASATGCNGSVTGNNTIITLKKNVGGRAVAADQFTVEVATAATGGTVNATATTSGTGTGQQATAGPFNALTNTTYYLRDFKTAGNLGSYNATIACTRNGVSFAPPLDGAGTGTAAAPIRWAVTTAANDNIDCTITNMPKTVPPTVRIEKVSTDGIGTFGFSGTNGVANHNISTISATVPQTGPNYTLAAANTVTTLTEGTPPLGYTLDNISCSGMGAGTATPDIANRTVTLNAAATANGNAIVCTFTNRKLKANISISKSNGVTDVIKGTNTTYSIVVSSAAGSDPATGIVVTDSPSAGLTCAPANTVTCSGAACPGGPLTVGQLTGAGITLGTLTAGSSATLTLTCQVN